jgi:hypothetical protein
VVRPTASLSIRVRALSIGLLGPAAQVIGVLWVVGREIVDPSWALSLQSMAFDAGFLMILVGLLTSLVCLPVAIEVALATPEEVEIPIFGPEASEPGPDGLLETTLKATE